MMLLALAPWKEAVESWLVFDVAEFSVCDRDMTIVGKDLSAAAASVVGTLLLAIAVVGLEVVRARLE